MDTPVDDFDLIRRYAEERNEDAFRELVERHSKAVYAVCHRRLRDVQHAEDATQRTFQILSRKAASIERMPLRPYLYRVATGCCADIRRAETRRDRREKRLQSAARMEIQSKQTRLVVATMEAALEQLSETYREALELRYILEFSVAEVAESLKISIPAAKQRLVRGLTELRSQMAHESNLAVIALPSLFALLQPTPQPGLADRIADAVLGPQPVRSMRGRTKPTMPPGTRTLWRAGGVGAAVACAVAAVALPTLLNPKTTVAPPATQAITNSPLLAPMKPQPPSTQPSLLEKLHRPYTSIAFHGPAFEQTIDITSRMSKIPVKCDWPSIEAAGIRRDTPIHTTDASGDALGEFHRIVNAASHDGRLECVIEAECLVVRARPSIASSHSVR